MNELITFFSVYVFLQIQSEKINKDCYGLQLKKTQEQFMFRT